MPNDKSLHASRINRGAFATTQWSVVLAAGRLQDRDSQLALSQLCESYWYPLYAYIRRRVGNVNDAQDLTQTFFAHLLEKDLVARADRSRGRFRAFLLTAVNNFLANQWQKEGAKKRGGHHTKLSLDLDAGESKFQIEPAHELTAEKLFERRWVTTLLDRVLERLQKELEAAGQRDRFEHLKDCLTGDFGATDYRRAAYVLGLTHAAAKQAAYRLRKRYRELFRQEVACTVEDDSEVDEEIVRLLAILAE